MTIAFDMDSVLCDMVEPWLEAYNSAFSDNLEKKDLIKWEINELVKPEARNKIFSYINEVGFYSKVKPIPHFIEMARNHVAMGDTVLVCTSCNNNYVMIGEKVKWLKKHTPFIPTDNYMFVNNKGLAKADLLVDDRVINVEIFLEANKFSRGLIVRYPHNREEIGRLVREHRYTNRVTISDEEY